MNMGAMATINQIIDQDTAILVVEELGHVLNHLNKMILNLKWLSMFMIQSRQSLAHQW